MGPAKQSLLAVRNYKLGHKGQIRLSNIRRFRRGLSLLPEAETPLSSGHFLDSSTTRHVEINSIY